MKQIKFSRVYPAYHPLKGEPTHFVEKIWSSHFKIYGSFVEEYHKFIDTYKEYANESGQELIKPELNIGKGHTIREGEYWSGGEQFAPTVWMGLPYRSKVLQFAPPIMIFRIYPVKIYFDGDSLQIFTTEGGEYVKPLNPATVAKNDGLTLSSFIDWFAKDRKTKFVGQIICWDPQIIY